ncbi:MAG: HNH endonuclease signature motif containing protein [bacterium]|nr:HNH endonuclease signature motif containing protein [bacterium]
MYHPCIRKRKWTVEQLKIAARKVYSVRQVIKALGLIPAGGNYAQIKKYIDQYRIDISHFKGKGWNKGLRGIGKPLAQLSEILVKGSTFQSYKLKRRLFNVGFKKPMCEECGWAKQATDGRLPLELDHINGDSRDNRLENLRILCPNCHSLKETHRGRNKKHR